MRALLVISFALIAPSLAHADVPGVIKGTVLFEGEPPDRPAQKRDADPVCAKTPQLADDVVVTKGKLRDVLVRVKNGTAGKFTAPKEPVTLDQHGCLYAPHVLGVMAGQTLRVKNSDATFHNVHGQISGKNVWNKPHAPKDADLSLETSMHADDVVVVRCDVHAWMHAYAVVQDHPYFAVTDDTGSFEIKGLSVGSYTLEAWHPTLGMKTLTVKIGRGKLGTVNARFSYKQTEQP